MVYILERRRGKIVISFLSAIKCKSRQGMLSMPDKGMNIKAHDDGIPEACSGSDP
jgi:hypothetical protein